MTTKAGEETEGRHAGGAKSRTARAEKATAEHEEATETLPMTRTEARATTGTGRATATSRLTQRYRERHPKGCGQPWRSRMEGERRTIRKGRARRMEKEVPRRPWWRGGTGGRKKGEEDERPAQAASRRRLLAISRHSQRTLATWEGFVKDGLKNIRTKKRRREEPAEDAVT